MNKSIIIIALIIFGLVQVGNAQSELEGHWFSTNILKVNGDSLNVLGERYKTNSELTFDNKTVYDEKGQAFEYVLNGQLLSIGNRLYLLNSLDYQKLILQEFDPQNPNNPFAKIIFYEKRK